MVEQIKYTPRIWNSQFNLRHVLQHITWVLNTNINIIGFNRCRNNTYAQHESKKCVYPYYIFQNSVVKLLRHPHTFPSIHLVYIKEQYYVLKSNNLKPYLINIHFKNSTIVFENQRISQHDIIDIIKTNPVSFPFNIKIYTSYYYTHTRSTRMIEKNMIGNYFAGSEKKTLHLFLTPLLDDKQFYLHVLSNFSTNNTYNKYNIIENRHIPEGRKFIQSKPSIDKSLNQDYCICDHPKTQQLFTPNISSFKPLGNIILCNQIYNILTFIYF
jgi:hypothetical protein